MNDINDVTARLLRLAAAITDQVGEAGWLTAQAGYNLLSNVGEVLRIYAGQFTAAQDQIDAREER